MAGVNAWIVLTFSGTIKGIMLKSEASIISEGFLELEDAFTQGTL